MRCSDERTEFYADVLSTAVEGGIGSWCQIESWNSADTDGRTKVVVTAWAGEDPAGDPQADVPALPKVIGIDELAHAFSVLRLAMDLDEDQDVVDFVGIHPTYIKDYLTAYRELDAGEIDAYDASAIFQVAVFGRSVFG